MIVEKAIGEEAQVRYLTYALSVVSGRALPDVRDGLKPVQRRILYAMAQNLHLSPDHSHRKSAAVVGEVLARFHPHGDTACYDALVRMAQDFSLRYPLIDGQGNFGSLDGDNAAAYRYTEARLRPIAMEVLGEIEEETVAFRDNFDSTLKEPIVFPSRVPNLLINGASGIAVGMATSIPPHNLKDVVRALLELSEDAEISETKLAGIVKAPDFPTGCQILNTRAELNQIYKTGKGAVRMRGEWKLEEGQRGKRFIIITAIPYAVIKAQLIEKIANLIIEKKIPQLTDVRDESTQEVRVVLELASDAEPEVAMAYLFRHTALESNFQVNFTALVPAGESQSTKPELLSLKQCLQHFLKFREEVQRNKLIFEKKNLEARIHILEGLALICDKLDEALKIVRKSDGRADAAEKLRQRFKLSELQAFAVVDMRIYQLSRTNIEEVRQELKEKSVRHKEIEKLLKSQAAISGLVRSDLNLIVEKFGDKRRCQLVTEHDEVEFDESDYVVQEDVYAIVTKDGWLKRIRQNNEVSSTRLREGDSILRAHPLSTLDSVAFFTNLGSLFVLKVADFPSSSGYGDPIQKILKFRDEEQVVASYAVLHKDSKPTSPFPAVDSLLGEKDQMVLVSRKGVGFALKMEGLDAIKKNGKRAMKLREDDRLAAVCHYNSNLALFTENAFALCIKGDELPQKDSPVIGVSLIGVRSDDKLVAALSFKTDCGMKLTLVSGQEKQVSTSEVVRGHRALKGNKIVARGQLSAVEFAAAQLSLLPPQKGEK